jgi:hypothetical protein
MRNYLIIILTLIPILVFSYTIEETLAQIESLKKELSHNEQIVEDKISNLKKSNPLFADQDPFESSAEYARRLKKGQPIIDNIRKQYLDDLLQKLGILRGRIFETDFINITLGKFNPDTQIYPMKITHFDYQQEIFDVEVDIEREKAKLLYQNWDKVNKTGILTIDIGDKIGLAKIQLTEPISDFNYLYEFQPFFTFNSPDASIISASFSSNCKYLAAYSWSKGIHLFNLIKKSKIKFINLRGNLESVYVKFSKDNKYIIAEWQEGYSYSTPQIVLYEILTDKIIENVKKTDSIVFSQKGDFICSIDNAHSISTDHRYKIKLEGSDLKYPEEVNVYRTFAQIESEVLAQKVISRPPSLSASVSFSETTGNQYLEALEKGEISVTVTNSGEGSGKGLSIKFDPERIEGLNYNNSYIEEIPASESVTVTIPIEAYIDVTKANHILRINFDEINGFPPAPVEIGFSTKAYLKPEMFIVDVGIEDNNKNGMIESGETTKLTIRIGNKGKGFATGAYAKFYSEDNVFITDSYPKVVSLGDLEYNQYIDVLLEFFVNDKAPDEIPLFVDLTEATGISGVNHLRIPILKSERTREIKRTVVAGIDRHYEDLDFENDLSVDIEQNIPKSNNTNKNALAIIFGIEDYRNVSNVNFAFRDATIMKEYFSKTIGIPEEQIYFRANDEVTLGEFRKIFADNGWLDKRVIENKTDIYFYYAGHGAPAIKEEKAFLIPFDGDPNYPVQTGYSLETVFENLSKLNANSATVFLDACFTGANRENEMLLADARPVSIQLKNNYVDNVTVFSATSSNEISSSYPKNKHGLFSYFLMKGMQGEADTNNDNKITITELFDYTKKNVSRIAGTLDREQTPQLECLDPDKIIINY